MARFPAITEDLVRRLDVPGPRYTSYPTVPVWSDGFGHDEHAAALERAAAAAPERPLSLYLHIPFCREMCTYCGCNVIVAKNPERADRYLDWLERELALTARHLGARRRLNRVHYGGGTPTFLDEKQLARLWRMIAQEFVVVPGAEVSVEIDPVVTRPSQIELLREQGFGRLSMGVQDFEPAVQSAVQRIQTVEETAAVIELARRIGFRSVNLDLIYGLPRQTAETWKRTLEQVVALRPDRMAVFSFAYVPEAKPHQRKLPVADIPRGMPKLALFGLAYDSFVDAGYRAIGMDHFALPDDELALAVDRRALWRDFQGYIVREPADGGARDTTDSDVDTVALGVTAISDVGGAYAQNVRTLPAYEKALAAGRFPTAKGHRLTPDDRRRRAVITRLMSNFWLDLGDEADYFAEELAALAPLEAEGLVERRGAVVTLTPIGRLFVRNAAMVFDAYLRRQATEARVFSQTV